MIFNCENKSTIDSELHVALSRSKIIFLSSSNSFLLNLFSRANITSDVTLDFRGIPLFHITTASSTFFPAALTKRTVVNLCFDFLPPFPFLHFPTNPLSGSALKNSQTCPCSKYFLISTLRLVPRDGRFF